MEATWKGRRMTTDDTTSDTTGDATTPQTADEATADETTTDETTTDETTTDETTTDGERAMKPTIFLGDSITEAGRWTQWFPELETVNMGIAGETTDDVIARLPEVIAADPGTVVVLVGTNDIGRRRRSTEYIGRNIETILVELRRHLPDARVILQSVMPRTKDFAKSVHQINVHIRQFSSVATARAEWLDLWPVLADDDGALSTKYSDDGLHLNEAGYAAWVEALRPVVLRQDGGEGHSDGRGGAGRVGEFDGESRQGVEPMIHRRREAESVVTANPDRP
jgi:lysophospholipase L1-like esterase